MSSGLGVGMMGGWLGWDVCLPFAIALIAIVYVTRYKAPTKPEKFIPTNIGQIRDGIGSRMSPLIVAAYIAGTSHSNNEGGQS
jgi:hypothetical protein